MLLSQFELKNSSKKEKNQSGVVAHTYNPSIGEGEVDS